MNHKSIFRNNLLNIRTCTGGVRNKNISKIFRNFVSFPSPSTFVSLCARTVALKPILTRGGGLKPIKP